MISNYMFSDVHGKKYQTEFFLLPLLSNGSQLLSKYFCSKYSLEKVRDPQDLQYVQIHL